MAFVLCGITIHRLIVLLLVNLILLLFIWVLTFAITLVTYVRAGVACLIDIRLLILLDQSVIDSSLFCWLRDALTSLLLDRIAFRIKLL